MIPEKIEAMREALQPIAKFIKINDGDTLARKTPDSAVVVAASGSWTGSTAITMGDLRKLATLARELG